MSTERISAPRIAVLVSGGGRSLENLVEHTRDGRLDAKVAVVITNKSDCGALERARRLELPSVVLDPDTKLPTADFSRDVFVAVESFGCDLVVLAGFLRLLEIPERWNRRVLNVHPSLLPAFGGKGFYGDKVHAAVLASGALETGCTVHYVTNDYDAGPILLQRTVPVRRDDDVPTLAARVFEEEKRLLPDAIRLYAGATPRQPATLRIREEQPKPPPAKVLDAGTLVEARVVRIEGDTIVAESHGIEARLHASDRRAADRFRPDEKFLALVQATPLTGQSVRLERTSAAFIERLIEWNVPEVADGKVRVRCVQRSPGQPTTVLVHSNDASIRALASCVGVRGARLRAVTQELRGELVDLKEERPGSR